MAETQETIADIRKEAAAKFRELVEAWMQRRSTFQTTLGAMQAFNNVFDRLDAAHRREIDELKKQVADLQQQLPKPDPNWRDICAKCFENGATEPPDCKYYTEDGCMSPIPDQHPLIQVGDVAKLREALVCLRDAAREFNQQILNSKYNGILDKYTCEKQGFSAALKVVGAIVNANYAIAAPARNCDRPECATTKAAADVWRKEDGGKTAYHEWLLAPATEKEGGAK